MEKTGLLAVLLFTLLLFGAAFLLPEESSDAVNAHPWEINISPAGNSQVLGITLKESTLAEAEQLWTEAPKVTLFLSEEERKVEAFFAQTSLGGIRASIVAEISLSEDQIEQLIADGTRISTQGDGSRKITLDGDGLDQVRKSTIISMTYLPKTNLSTEIIERRFGKPAEIIQSDPVTAHWIYPNDGLDIAISSEGREVLQYVPPSEIDRLIAPLRKAATE